MIGLLITAKISAGDFDLFKIKQFRDTDVKSFGEFCQRAEFDITAFLTFQ